MEIDFTLDVFHLAFCNRSPAYFDVSVRSALHPGALLLLLGLQPSRVKWRRILNTTT